MFLDYNYKILLSKVMIKRQLNDIIPLSQCIYVIGRNT